MQVGIMLRFAIYPNFQKKNAFSCALTVCRKLHELGGMIYMEGCFSTGTYGCWPRRRV